MYIFFLSLFRGFSLVRYDRSYSKRLGAMKFLFNIFETDNAIRSRVFVDIHFRSNHPRFGIFLFKNTVARDCRHQLDRNEKYLKTSAEER